MDVHPDQPTPLAMYVDALSEACSLFSTVELCLVWRQSFAISKRLEDPEDKLRLARLREAFIDEFERRDPAALEAWLNSSAAPDITPIGFFSASLHDRP